MPAGVAEAGQGVVLQEKRHRRPPPPGPGRERGRQIGGLPPHLEPRPLQLVRERRRGPVLGERGLRIGVQRAGDGPQGVRPPRHLLPDEPRLFLGGGAPHLRTGNVLTRHGLLQRARGTS
ncbi:hypothetical protein [Streptomyces misionensis]|uniref:hypothetical protein n=1 Tax=Streptomyces misionensis TaxID=67331 RepID=UPI003CC55D92